MKSNIFIFTTLIFACALTAPKAEAQGYPNCYNVQGIQVGYYPEPSVNDIAIATTAPNGAPVVLWNPGIVNAMHPATIEFFYYHECAHHALGHPLGNYGPGGEAIADCWAKKQMIGLGVLTQQKYGIIRQQLMQFSKPGMDWPNGQVRVSYLDNC